MFAEVTIDPDNPLSVSPFIIEEFLEVELNGVNRQVLLEAYGQNANYLPSRFGQGGAALVSCDFDEITFDEHIMIYVKPIICAVKDTDVRE